ncbi:methylenetetrahydrofolate reductase [NAD(P)H] [Caproiciproducens sp. CPB-2]|uniref:methylenetetrahydrofolate reductase [NAD(P)H] n=1 Tax=Caproiciproducens sp. CPB-2 TaxID=3030017 RepID=UPI0023DB6B52|nr:methylenetetrahydrofolate reductase [NAD(P)H] [Caproiciproducens sp. CPB-2]MDF1494651.1 methylenetetrahydrofolate reductase [NAD(P)H] [Caproiciproducens sp. CPB-2]
MKISEILNSGRVTVSCELFPPKKDDDIARVKEVVRDISALRPDFMSVTYGAGGGTSRNTARIASEIQNCGVTALAHLTCVSSTREEVGQILSGLKEQHIENVLALRGDIPQNSDFPSPGQYRYAGELVRQIREYGGFCIGAACYPEGHVECAHREDDIGYLKEKVDSGCDFLTTQMFFDNNILYQFLYRILAKGIHIPVVAGIMPVTNSGQIRRICALSGTELPPRFRAIVDKFADKPAAMKQAGIAYATEQIIDLISNGVSAIHIYTMNKPDIAAKIMDNLSEIIRE